MTIMKVNETRMLDFISAIWNIFVVNSMHILSKYLFARQANFSQHK